MNQEWDALLSEFKAVGEKAWNHSKERPYDMNATVNVWYVIARIEEVLLNEEHNRNKLALENIELKVRVKELQSALLDATKVKK